MSVPEISPETTAVYLPEMILPESDLGYMPSMFGFVLTGWLMWTLPWFRVAAEQGNAPAQSKLGARQLSSEYRRAYGSLPAPR